MSSLKLIKTDDGSSSLFSDLYNSSYHSMHGACQESKHIFIEHGLKYFHEKDKFYKNISILEYGMGTGLNVLLALEYAEKQKISIVMHTIELHPIEAVLVDQLNYTKITPLAPINALKAIHETPWNETLKISPFFTIHKHRADFFNFKINKQFDIIFYDCFGPGSQPKLWDTPYLSKIKEQMKTDSVLTTFCAQGKFKRALKSLSFCVEALPGPPGKREMTRASLS